MPLQYIAVIFQIFLFRLNNETASANNLHASSIFIQYIKFWAKLICQMALQDFLVWFVTDFACVVWVHSSSLMNFPRDTYIHNSHLRLFSYRSNYTKFVTTRCSHGAFATNFACVFRVHSSGLTLFIQGTFKKHLTLQEGTLIFTA
jgi:hypothetical protein